LTSLVERQPAEPAARTPQGAPSADRDPASWRDPSGFVYRRDGVLFRQIAPSFLDRWRAFSSGDLASKLVADGRLLPWTDGDLTDAADDRAAAVIRPELLEFISYPYEWTFGELKDAALLTLDVQLDALAAGFRLRDASAYNVQFRGVTPVLIDHLSFEPATADAPWVAYRQFCEHFLAPLVLMDERDVRMGRLLRAYLDGIPLDLAAGLVPGRTRLRLGLATHLHLHARAQRQHAGDGTAPAARPTLSAGKLRNLLESLRGTIEGIRWSPAGTEWADYADQKHASYGDGEAKERAVRKELEEVAGAQCWDLGANTGRYSRIAADLGYTVLSFDIDPAAAERNYRALRAESRAGITPLVMDLADPSPSLGWAERERAGLVERANADVSLALALVHHLAIGRNVPFPMILDLLADLAPHAIVEWVPRGDPMVERLLVSREDIFGDYTEDGFAAAAGRRFEVVSRNPIEGSARVLYHLRRR
jgi:ribosomal protein L11 methylase PrmA